jgi:hypothetical protein
MGLKWPVQREVALAEKREREEEGEGKIGGRGYNISSGCGRKVTRNRLANSLKILITLYKWRINQLYF